MDAKRPKLDMRFIRVRTRSRRNGLEEQLKCKAHQIGFPIAVTEVAGNEKYAGAPLEGGAVGLYYRDLLGFIRLIVFDLLSLALAGFLCRAQQASGQPVLTPVVSPAAKPDTKSHATALSRLDRASGYVLGAGDQIAVHVLNVEEISEKPISIDLSGYIRLPMIGRLPASGSTAEQLAAEIAKRLEIYVKNPDVSITVTEFRSQPVSVLGAVKNPGVQQVQGQKTLLEILSLAGGVDSATAGVTLKITRRLEWGPLPLPSAANDPTEQFSVAQVSVKSLLEAKNPQENILIKPYDVISVPRGETFYVIGEVPKPGGFVLNDSEQVTVLKALSMAGGIDKLAQPQHARILRQVPGVSSRTTIPVDLKKILDGKTADVRMQAEDILFVPNSISKRAAIRAIEAAIQMGTGIAIWRP